MHLAESINLQEDTVRLIGTRSGVQDGECMQDVNPRVDRENGCYAAGATSEAEWPEHLSDALITLAATLVGRGPRWMVSCRSASSLMNSRGEHWRLVA